MSLSTDAIRDHADRSGYARDVFAGRDDRGPVVTPTSARGAAFLDLLAAVDDARPDSPAGIRLSEWRRLRALEKRRKRMRATRRRNSR